MKKLLILSILIMMNSCSSPKASINENGNLYGIATKADFQKNGFDTWYNEEYHNYTVNKNTIESLKEKSKNITIKAFMGTWCSDSRRETPRFYKILDVIDFNMKNFQLVAVNRDKKSPNGLEKGKHIDYVPTFIFYENDKEIGRIVESPIVSLEEDFLTIINHKPYTPNYAE